MKIKWKCGCETEDIGKDKIRMNKVCKTHKFGGSYSQGYVWLCLQHKENEKNNN